mmetsp:Transcript_22236/g.30324  ORF Transcript_22236/g.30324 Transcript_22236/m.30324 type:complete len:322 (+) Transcript_22236:895-1860(+)
MSNSGRPRLRSLKCTVLVRNSVSFIRRSSSSSLVGSRLSERNSGSTARNIRKRWRSPPQGPGKIRRKRRTNPPPIRMALRRRWIWRELKQRRAWKTWKKKWDWRTKWARKTRCTGGRISIARVNRGTSTGSRRDTSGTNTTRRTTTTTTRRRRQSKDTSSTCSIPISSIAPIRHATFSSPRTRKSSAFFASLQALPTRTSPSKSSTGSGSSGGSEALNASSSEAFCTYTSISNAIATESSLKLTVEFHRLSSCGVSVRHSGKSETCEKRALCLVMVRRNRARDQSAWYLRSDVSSFMSKYSRLGFEGTADWMRVTCRILGV